MSADALIIGRRARGKLSMGDWLPVSLGRQGLERQLTNSERGAAFGRWPPQAIEVDLAMKGGGHACAGLRPAPARRSLTNVS
jgi:hypothetical protein